MHLPAAAVSALVVFSIVLCAGPVKEEDFPSTYAKVQCKKMKKCEKADWEANFENQAECEAELAGYAEDVLDVVTIFCDYDEDIARSSISALKSANCEEWDDGVEIDVCE